jgi:hypothetical protein
MTEPVVGGLLDRATLAERVDAGAGPDRVAAHSRTFRHPGQVVR